MFLLSYDMGKWQSEMKKLPLNEIDVHIAPIYLIMMKDA